MTRIAFIGLGNMGGGMAANQAKAGHEVVAFDLSKAALDRAAASGCRAAASVAEAVKDAEAVVTMLPAGPHVRQVYAEHILPNAPKTALLIDCSTIDVESARAVAADAAEAGLAMVDAPVSGGVAGAAGGTLTFMVGGPDDAFARAEPFLQKMGKTIVHAGGAGNGQAAKICSNMILGISMIAVSEAFTMAEKLGLDTARLFAISSKASGQCWSMTNYCPVPGLVESAPSNRDFKPGFTASMMLKDLTLAEDAAETVHAATPLGREAARLYRDYVESGHGAVDFSGIIQMLRAN